ncbi:hypothetical protein HY483_01810 [Candidatus Woesearchaeota archaeon]|nr:hypothetical protein [Candidatus Woesearchaeota archaeon]
MIKSLKEWVLYYLRHKDTIKREILDISVANNGFIVKTVNNEWTVQVCGSLEKFPVLESSEKVLLFTLNTKNNLNFLYKYWNDFKKPNITIYFVNPVAGGDKSWAVNPYVHSLIADDSSLMQGLESLFQTVEEVVIK